MNVKAGTLTSPATTGNQSYSGIGFQPKLVLFFLTLGGSANQLAGGWGAAASSSDRFSLSYGADNGAGTMNTAVHGSETRCLTIHVGGTSTISRQADFVSFDSDGFTLNWTTAGTGVTVRYIAFGGADLSVDVGVFDCGGSTGDVAVTGVGFQPDCLIVTHERKVTSLGQSSTAALSFGAASSPSDQACFSQLDRDGSNNCEVETFCKAGAVALSREEGAAESYEAALSSFDSDGFTLNVSNARTAGSLRHGYVAVKGAQFKVGVETQKTSTGTKATTGVGFQPLGLLLFTAGNVAAATGSSGQAWHMGFGAWDGTAAWTQGGYDQDAAGTSNNRNYESSSSALDFVADNAATVVGSADVQTLDSDGFTLDWTTADANARQFGYLAFASVPDSPGFMPRAIVI